MKIVDYGTGYINNNLDTPTRWSPDPVTAAGLRATIAAIPDDDLLGVMACPIWPESARECLVCRLVDPVYGNMHGGSWEDPANGFAAKYNTGFAAAEQLFNGTQMYTAFVEELIAERLDDIVFGKSVGQAV